MMSGSTPWLRRMASGRSGVTPAVLEDEARTLPTHENQETKKNEIKRIFDACLAMNDERVRIAHGTWTIGGGARHVARSSLKARFHFDKTESIVEKTREIRRLMASAVRLLGWEPAKNTRPVTRL